MVKEEKMRIFFVVFLFFCISCGYRFSESEKATISVPYIKGDRYGFFTEELIYSLSLNGLKYKTSGADYRLIVEISGEKDNQIGYLHDRDNTGKPKKNIMPTENMVEIFAKVSLLDRKNRKYLIKDRVISFSVDYDYLKQDSLQDLSFIENGQRRTVLDFSLGQLETKESAKKAAMKDAYQGLSSRIVTMLKASL